MFKADEDRRMLDKRIPDRRFLDRRFFDRRLFGERLRDIGAAVERRLGDRRSQQRRSGIDRRSVSNNDARLPHQKRAQSASKSRAPRRR